MKAELDPSESERPAPASASLKVLGVAFVLFCVVVAGAIMWDLFPVNIESMFKIAATFVLIAVAVVAILFLARQKN